jgi:hypothetical protein
MTLQNPPKAEEPQANPYTPALPQPQIMENFGGVNTSTTRAGVPDQMCYWIDGFMPVAPRNLRTLPGVGPELVGPFSGGRTIISFGFYNIGATPYALYFLSDGSVQTVNTTGTPITTQILPPATITNPAITNYGFSQWGQQYLLIVANQTNGYWIWDGTLVYESGSLSPIITLTNPGAGYQTIPSVTASGGSGNGAIFAAQIANGVVTSVSIINPGTGYLAGQTVSLVFTGGTAAGSGASITAIMAHASGSNATIALTFKNTVSTFYSVIGATVIAAGSGYSPFAVAAVNQNPEAGGQAANLTLTVTSGSISGVAVSGYVNGFGGYGSYNGMPPTDALITDNGDYYVSGVSIAARGTGYSDTASITVTGGGASIITPAAFSPIITGGSLSSVLITNGGQYGSNVAPTLALIDTPITAAGTVQLMPFAISGTAIETYQGRAWIANGPTVYFAAPGSFTDFATSDGGGNFTSGDNFLRVSYVRLVNTNGFLYLIADSSMNYISGVTTSGDPPTTTFTNQNADPEIGTPYPASVLTRGRDIVLANSVGVHISRGAQLDKVSETLDGVWGSVPNFGSLTQLSSAKATVFSKRIWMVLAQIVDPVANTTQNKLLIWNGKDWYSSVQDFGPLTYIATQEINSVLTAWGTDGNVIKPLFQNPSLNFQKTVQSRYWDAPGGYQFSKASSRFWSVWDYNVTGSLNMVVSIDAVGISGANGTTFSNSATYTIPSPAGTGYFVTPPEAVGQQGVLTGMTIKTNEADLSLVSAMLQNDPRISYRG